MRPSLLTPPPLPAPLAPSHQLDYNNTDTLSTLLFATCSWAVIASYFADKTLVSQQIDSFNEFVNNTMQELVDEGATLILDQNMQHTGKANDVTVRSSATLCRVCTSWTRSSESALLTSGGSDQTETLRAQLWSNLPF